MNSPQPPKSNYKALSGAYLAYALTNDGKKIRYALWPTGNRGLIIFLNGRNEYIRSTMMPTLVFRLSGTQWLL